MKRLKAVLIGALILCPLSSDGLAAAASNDARPKVVKFADLDLTQSHSYPAIPQPQAAR